MRSVLGILFVGLLGMKGGWMRMEVEGTEVSSCPTCDPDYCPKSAQECSHGLLRDSCGCCKEGVCLLWEKEKCFNIKLFKNITETDFKKFGACGEDMECILRTDVKAGEIAESVCQCKRVEVSCGRDNVTYPSVCKLREAGTELAHSGPCSSGPEIIGEPETISGEEHESVSLNCWVKGFPVPTVHWEVETLNGLFKTLPGDDPSVTVHCRGGPEPLTITSWLMIDALRKKDAGTYICVATNSEGVSRVAASVKVLDKKS